MPNGATLLGMESHILTIEAGEVEHIVAVHGGLSQENAVMRRVGCVIKDDVIYRQPTRKLRTSKNLLRAGGDPSSGKGLPVGFERFPIHRTPFGGPCQCFLP